MTATPLFAAIFALMLVALSIRTLRLRRELTVPIGHGNEPKLERAARAHANFCEYVPISLLLLWFLETAAGTSIWIYTLCASLLAGRLVHAYGVSQVRENYRFRVTGMALTFTVIIVTSGGIIIAYA